ncbi:MAG: AzlD domain-containing protein [Clostridia bacterium]|nr:AzlD domain-containing protein [Clostridia bacterium]
MSTVRLTGAIIIMAVVTYVIRLLPLTFFRRRITNPHIKAFLNFVPYAVLGAMTFPDVFSSTGSTLSALIGTAAAFFLACRGRGLLTVSLVSCAIACAVDIIAGIL